MCFSVWQCFVVSVRCRVACIAVCCSVLQRVAACFNVLQCVAVSCSVCCSALQCVVVCCSVLQHVACVAVCCSVSQCVAACCIFSLVSLVRTLSTPRCLINCWHMTCVLRVIIGR